MGYFEDDSKKRIEQAKARFPKPPEMSDTEYEQRIAESSRYGIQRPNIPGISRNRIPVGLLNKAGNIIRNGQVERNVRDLNTSQQTAMRRSIWTMPGVPRPPNVSA